MGRLATCDCGECKKCKHRVYMREYYYRNERWSGGLVDSQCGYCGGVFRATGRSTANGRKFCSQSCKVMARSTAQKQVREQAKPERSCRHCGLDMPTSMRSDAAFCSAKCNSAAHHLKRGNGRIGPGRRRDIERAFIIQRDGGRCHICGELCRPEEITLDHVLPLAKGGTHSSDNLAVAHLSCNCSKGARSTNDHLLLTS